MKALSFKRITAKALLGACTIACSIGCGGSSPKTDSAAQKPIADTADKPKTQPKTPKPSPVVVELEAIVDTACVCSDGDCISAEWKNIELLSQKYTEANEADTVAVSQLLEKMDSCGSSFRSKTILKFDAIKTKICKCETTACVEKASKAFLSMKEPKTTSELDRREFMRMADEMSKCVAQLAADGK